ncbi:MAG: ATP-binding protein [Spirochaetia bacterium]
MNKRTIIILYCLLTLSLIDPIFAEIALEDERAVPLYTNTLVIEDHEQELTPMDVFTMERSDFTELRETSVPEYGYSIARLWCRATIINRTGNDEIIIAPNDASSLQTIDLYYFEDEQLQSFSSSSQQPIRERNMEYRLPGFRVDHPSGTARIYVFSISSENRLRLNLHAYSLSAFLEKLRLEYILYSIVFGIVSVMILYNVLVYISINENIYLYYIVYAFTYGLYLLGLHSLDSILIWPYIPEGMLWFFHATVFSPFIGGIALTFAIVFSMKFFSTKRTNRTIHRIFQYLIGFSLLLSGISLLSIPYQYVSIYGNLISVLIVLYIILISIHYSLLGNRSALLFLVSHAAVVAGIVLYSLSAIGAFPRNIITLNFNLFGPLTEVILLSLTLVFRYNELTRKQELVQQRAIENLKEAEKLKDDFLANTSHELKTPIHGIVGIADSLAQGAAGDLPPGAKDNLSIIINSGRHLTKIVDQILDFSKLKNAEVIIYKQSVDIILAGKSSARLLQPLADEKGITLYSSFPPGLPQAFADEHRVQQIFHNILENAIKYTEKGVISITASPKDEFIEVVITDTGIGIAEKDIDRVFESFQQAEDSLIRQHGGVGLGLSITKKLVELQEGRIWVESVQSEGTSVHFTLPKMKSEYEIDELPKIEEEEGELLEIFPEPEQVRRQITIYICDRDETNMKIMDNYLSLEEYFVQPFYSAEQLLHTLDEKIQPDLILLGFELPDTGGPQCCIEIRKNYSLADLPIIIILSNNALEFRLEAYHSGSNDCMAKPIQKEEFFARIKTHLTASRLNRVYKKFIPEEFVKSLGKESIADISAGDHIEKNMCVLFSDIRAFSTLSEKLGTFKTFAFLNKYLTSMIPIIKEHKGFIDKFIGDAIMALFPPDADEALVCAIRMQTTVYQFNKNIAASLEEPISIGVGLHTGDLMLGAIGGEDRMENTVISDAVNTAARLEELTKALGAKILISGETFIQLEDPTRYNYRFLGKIRIKGKMESVTVFEVFEGETVQIIEKKRSSQRPFEEAVNDYMKMEFQKAKELFKFILMENSDDLAAEYYYKECEHNISYGVSEKWDGSLSLKDLH